MQEAWLAVGVACQTRQDPVGQVQGIRYTCDHENQHSEINIQASLRSGIVFNRPVVSDISPKAVMKGDCRGVG